jgi:superfamily II DNA helicase RecQ
MTNLSSQEEKMAALGLKGLVINGDTIHEAQVQGEDIWAKAVTEPSIVFMAPEQLISPGFGNLSKNDSEFAVRVSVIVVDEAHLLNTWGKSWRKAFTQIGWVRARFNNVVLVALTATMRGGEYIGSVCHFLGLHRGQFHLIRKSNVHPDVQVLFRTLYSGIGGKKFPELLWVLRDGRKTIIFCRTINLGFRIFEYLCAHAEANNSNIKKRVRLYNSLNWPEYNAQTRRLMEDDTDCQILIGTDTLSVGVDISTTQDVLVIGEPEDIDELVQKFGRPGRDKAKVTDARGILYLPQGSDEKAQRVIAADKTKDKTKLRKGDTMDVSIARLAVAPCLIREQRVQYDDTSPWSPESCNCSGKGCQPEHIKAPTFEKKAHTTKKSKVPKGKALTRAMRKLATKELLTYRMRIWDEADEIQTGLYPPDIFFSDGEIKAVLDCFVLLLDGTRQLSELLSSNSLLAPQFGGLRTLLQDLNVRFEPIRTENKEREKVARARRAAERRAALQTNTAKESNEDGSDLEALESEDEEMGNVSDTEQVKEDASKASTHDRRSTSANPATGLPIVEA